MGTVSCKRNKNDCDEDTYGELTDGTLGDLEDDD